MHFTLLSDLLWPQSCDSSAFSFGSPKEKSISRQFAKSTGLEGTQITQESTLFFVFLGPLIRLERNF
jgi:hypothetical protein